VQFYTIQRQIKRNGGSTYLPFLRALQALGVELLDGDGQAAAVVPRGAHGPLVDPALVHPPEPSLAEHGVRLEAPGGRLELREREHTEVGSLQDPPVRLTIAAPARSCWGPAAAGASRGRGRGRRRQLPGHGHGHPLVPRRGVMGLGSTGRRGGHDDVLRQRHCTHACEGSRHPSATGPETKKQRPNQAFCVCLQGVGRYDVRTLRVRVMGLRHRLDGPHLRHVGAKAVAHGHHKHTALSLSLSLSPFSSVGIRVYICVGYPIVSQFGGENVLPEQTPAKRLASPVTLYTSIMAAARGRGRHRHGGWRGLRVCKWERIMSPRAAVATVRASATGQRSTWQRTTIRDT
jgi:hypothetical protein